MSDLTCRTCERFDGVGAPCHRCAFMPDREILPGCMGTAAGAMDGKDLSRCTCDRVKADPLVKRVRRLEKAVAELRGLAAGNREA